MWRLYLMVCLSGLFFVGELIASQLAQSLILVMDSYHMLYNAMSVLLLVVSYKMSKKKPTSNTFGWARLDVLGVLVNLLFFSALCFAVIIEGIQGLLHVGHQETRPTYPFLVLTCGASRLVINILAWILIGGYTRQQRPLLRDQNSQNVENIPAIGCRKDTEYSGRLMTDILRDNSGCLLVICCGCLVYFLDEYVPPYVELVFSLLAVIIILVTSYHFIQESGLILLQTVPDNMDMETMKRRLIKEFPVILNIHDVHVWRLNTFQTIATIHIVLPSVSFYVSIKTDLVKFFNKEGITTVTIQPEFAHGDNLQKISECFLRCSSSYNCGALTCCGELLRKNQNNLDSIKQTKIGESFSYPVETFADSGLVESRNNQLILNPVQILETTQESTHM